MVAFRHINSLVLVLILSLAGISPIYAQEVDFARYQELIDASQHAMEALAEAGAEAPDEMREATIVANRDVTTWLQAFFASEAHASLTPEQREAALRDMYRAEYNIAQQLIALDRCEEARDQVRALLDGNIEDQELRPRLTQSYEDALSCISRERTARLRVSCVPSDARIHIDGVYVGLADVEHAVGLGEHRLELTADGYASSELVFDAASEGQLVEVGPVELLLVVEPVSKSPNWYEWSLWTLGLGGTGVGVAYWFMADARENQIANPPDGHIIIDLEAEQQIADDLRLVSIVSGSVGLAAVLVGTLSYALRDGAPPQSDDDLTWGLRYGVISLQGRF